MFSVYNMLRLKEIFIAITELLFGLWSHWYMCMYGNKRSGLWYNLFTRDQKNLHYERSWARKNGWWWLVNFIIFVNWHTYRLNKFTLFKFRSFRIVDFCSTNDNKHYKVTRQSPTQTMVIISIEYRTLPLEDITSILEQPGKLLTE